MEEPMKQQVNQMDQLRHQASNRLHFSSPTKDSRDSSLVQEWITIYPVNIS